MFGKKRRREPAITTLVGRDTRVHGDLEFTGGCLIDGHVVGNVLAVGEGDALLSISARGCVEGAIEVPNVLLNGTVHGDVRALQRVELGKTAKVHGNVEYGLIEMAIGAEVNGKLVHTSEFAGAEKAMAEPAASRPGPAQPDRERASDGPVVGDVNVVGESR